MGGVCERSWAKIDVGALSTEEAVEVTANVAGDRPSPAASQRAQVTPKEGAMGPWKPGQVEPEV